nr:NADH dehydrogenase subunit 2 [Hypselosoma matsumurae]
MTKNSSKLMFMMLSMMGIIITMSSNNWFSMWMGMEINLMGFLPLMLEEKNSLSPEAIMIYFLIQSLMSILFMMIILISSISIMSTLFMDKFTKMIVTTSMLMKMGVPPFHFWFLMIMNKIEWKMCIMLMTIQKLNPLIILSSIIYQEKYLILIMSMMSTIVGAIGGMNQSSLKMIMAYSSINHSGWMMSCLLFNNQLWLMYMIIYAMMITPIFMYMNYNSLNFLMQLMMNSKIKENMVFSMSMMSMGGMPPMLGFINKMIVIQEMMKNGMIMIMLIMIMMSVIILFYYSRIMMITIINKSMNQSWNMKMKAFNTKWILMLNLIMPIFTVLNLL